MANQALRKTKDFTPNGCPVTYCMNLIGGKWKPVIIHMLRREVNRYGILLKAMPDISKQTLTNQLRELETDGIISRVVYAEIPPRVEYSITDFGKTLLPVIDMMATWGIEQLKASDQWGVKG